MDNEKQVKVQYMGTNSIKAMNYKWDWQKTETVPITVAEELCKSELFIMVNNKSKKTKIEVEE